MAIEVVVEVQENSVMKAQITKDTDTGLFDSVNVETLASGSLWVKLSDGTHTFEDTFPAPGSYPVTGGVSATDPTIFARWQT
jgi:hypothetical protein